MGDLFNVEEILAEEEDAGFLEHLIATGTGFVSSYGWFFLAGGIALYFVWKNYRIQTSAAPRNPLSQKELAEFQNKEEARQRYIAKLQGQYEKDAVVRSDKIKQMEEEKKKARLDELEKLDTGNKLGTSKTNLPVQPNSGPSSKGSKPKSNSLRPEYNPLMGDTSGSSGRSCFQRPGRSGG